MSHIVKRAGHKEKYDSRKVYASVYAACLAVRVHPGEAELVADKVTQEINAWVTSKKEVDSGQIFLQISVSLRKFNPDAAYIYHTHRDVN
jgi:transcriptional regulator NrdR family protein